MQFYCLIFILLVGFVFGFCQIPKVKDQDSKVYIITKKENQKYNLIATFYGSDFHLEDENNTITKIIKYVVIRDNKNNSEFKYEATGTVSAADFYFTDVWSPNEEYLVLPVGKFEGFAVFQAKDVVKNITSNNYFDVLKVKSKDSGWFWHDFEKWENDSTLSFKAGLSGDRWIFKYDLAKKELYCYSLKCEETNFGENKRGEVKAIKKGDIEIIKK